MHIIQTPVRFYPDIGGVENYVHDLSKKFVQMGHDVTVICSETEETDPGHETIDGIEVIRLSSVGQIANTNITPTLPYTLIRELNDADVIHTHLPTPWSADWSVILGKIARTPTVVTYHNDIPGQGILKYVSDVYNTTALRITLSFVDEIIITQSDYLQNSKYLERYKEKVSVVQNGVDIERFRPLNIEDWDYVQSDSELGTIFFLSVLDEYHEYKGLDVLLEAMKLLISEYESTPDLIIGGDGPLVSVYKKMAAELGIEEHVQFLGRIPDSKLVEMYNYSDLFVLPSVSSEQEGFGLVLLEALACGTPVVSTDIVGVSGEIESNEVGRIVEPDNPSQLASAIYEIFNTSGSFDTNHCRKICVEDYSLNLSAKKMISLYENIQ